MIDFSTLQGLTIPEGVVTQITDESGRVIWAVSGGKVILEVEKITSNTYASETTYENEQFILLDIYPKTNGTVSVTYGGLTKTITDTSGAEDPNAQQVYFGTFNGVSDSVETPKSGELTIEGDYYAFACGQYDATKMDPYSIYDGLTAVKSFGGCTVIPTYAFGSSTISSCTGLTSVTISSGVTNIGSYAFIGCTGLTSINIPKTVINMGISPFTGCIRLTNIMVAASNKHYSSDGGVLFNKDKSNLLAYPSASGHCTIPESVVKIGSYAFIECDRLTSITIPTSVTSIENYAFSRCSGLALTSLPNRLTSIGINAFYHCEKINIREIPDGVTSIGASAFQMEAASNNADGITEMTSIVLPATLKSIGNYAFAMYVSDESSYFTYLSEIAILATTPPTLGTDVFGKKCYKPITVPKGCGEAYKAAEGWSAYADYIVEAS